MSRFHEVCGSTVSRKKLLWFVKREMSSMYICVNLNPFSWCRKNFKISMFIRYNMDTWLQQQQVNFHRECQNLIFSLFSIIILNCEFRFPLSKPFITKKKSYFKFLTLMFQNILIGNFQTIWSSIVCIKS